MRHLKRHATTSTWYSDGYTMDDQDLDGATDDQKLDYLLGYLDNLHDHGDKLVAHIDSVARREKLIGFHKGAISQLATIVFELREHR